MQTRVGRFILLALLVVVVFAAGVMLFELESRSRTVDDAAQDLATRIERLTEATFDIAANQSAYVAPGQDDEPALQRVTTLMQQSAGQVDSLARLTQSPDSAPRLQALATSSAELEAADKRAREDVRFGNDLMAADVIFRDARGSLSQMRGVLAEIRTTEAAFADARRADIDRQRWIVLGSTAGALMLGAVLLTPLPRRPTEWRDGPQAARVPDTAPMVASTPAAATPLDAEPPVDLDAAAALCTALSRVTSAEALPELLGRAATLLDASGIIVWMSAGEELFPASAYGYDPRVISRLGPIGRAADNATAAAWRSGTVGIVAGESMSNGAIVAPLFGPDCCVGVLAVEVRHRREQEPATRAVTALIAAQLATVIAAWPAASTSNQEPHRAAAPMPAAGP